MRFPLPLVGGFLFHNGHTTIGVWLVAFPRELGTIILNWPRVAVARS